MAQPKASMRSYRQLFRRSIRDSCHSGVRAPKRRDEFTRRARRRADRRQRDERKISSGICACCDRGHCRRTHQGAFCAASLLENGRYWGASLSKTLREYPRSVVEASGKSPARGLGEASMKLFCCGRQAPARLLERGTADRIVLPIKAAAATPN